MTQMIMINYDFICENHNNQRHLRSICLRQCIFLIALYLVPYTFSFAQSIAGGGLHSLTLCSDSTVMAWGYNINGQLGLGDTTDRWTPEQVHGPGNVGFLASITALASGGNPLEGVSHSLALKNDGTVWAWGYNINGQLGDGDTTERWTPVQVHGPGNAGFLTSITTIAGGGYHTLALKNDGTVWAWGKNSNGQLGVGDTNSRYAPVLVNLLTGITALSAGWGNSIALKNDGTVWSWGQNYFGQLGLGDTTDRWIPVQVSGLTGITAISGGGGHTLALKNDGTAWAWGYNQFGQVGDSTDTTRNSPVQVNMLTGVSAIAGGAGHSLTLKNDGTVWAWGFNQLGQVGDGTTINRNFPVQVSPAWSGSISAISGGGGHSLALKNDGTAWAWGYNATGQLGDGTDTTRNTPVQVSTLCFVNGISQATSHKPQLAIYPNPSKGEFWFSSKGVHSDIHSGQIQLATGNGAFRATASIEIYNVLGELVLDLPVNQLTNQPINLSARPDGIYFVRVNTNEGIVSKKILISR